jgi:CspA family cold shock protein
LRNGTVAGYTVFREWRPAGQREPAAAIPAIISGTMQMAEGTIKKLMDRGFGFIKTDSEKELFFHSSSLQGVSFDELREGQKVSYTEGQGKKGPCAENVKPV